MTTIDSTYSLEEMLTSAVRMHWKEFGAASDTLLHIEYHRLPSNRGLEFFKVWSSTTYGVWDLACEYRMAGVPLGPDAGLTFHPPFYSAGLDQIFTGIMQNQLCFADRAVQWRDGLIQVEAPSPEAIEEAQAAIQKAFADCDIHAPETGTAE